MCKAMCRARIDGSSYLEASTTSTPTPTGAEERVEGTLVKEPVVLTTQEMYRRRLSSRQRLRTRVGR